MSFGKKIGQHLDLVEPAVAQLVDEASLNNKP